MEIYMTEFLPEVSRVFLENILEKIKTEFHQIKYSILFFLNHENL